MIEVLYSPSAIILETASIIKITVHAMSRRLITLVDDVCGSLMGLVSNKSMTFMKMMTLIK